MDYTAHVKTNRTVEKKNATLVTPQSQPIPGKNMVQNSAGGYSFELSDWDRLERFLILGSEGGTFYASEKQLTKKNAKCVERLLKKEVDGLNVVRKIVEISAAGRAHKNDPAIFALAMASAAKHNSVRKAALQAIPDVCRIGTHLFHYAQFVEAFRGWGRGLREAVAKWYSEKDLDSLMYQVMKYKQRDGWSHRDLLRLSHPLPSSDTISTLFKWIVSPDEVRLEQHGELARLAAAELCSTSTNEDQIVDLIEQFSLPREVINTSMLNRIPVWEALLQNMPLNAMVRNLGKMSSLELFKNKNNLKKVVEALHNEDAIRKAKLHPLAILIAHETYKTGHGLKGSLTWKTVEDIMDSLDDAFYLSFSAIEPANKRFLLGIDVSGSMSSPISGAPSVSCAVASAVMAMVTRRTEGESIIRGFANSFKDLDIRKRDTLESAITKVRNQNFGGTDCSLPMIYAMKNNLEIDTFVVYTDNETWAGNIQPVQALRDYRRKSGIPAKLIVVGMSTTGFTIADPNDSGMMDVVGFDADTPAVISGFARE